MKKLMHLIFSLKENSLTGYIKKKSLSSSQLEAYILPNRTPISYQELFENIELLKLQLTAEGIDEKSRIGLIINDSATFLTLALAVSDCAICVPFSTELTKQEAEKQFKSTEITHLISDSYSHSSKDIKTLRLKESPLVIEIDTTKKLTTYPYLTNKRTCFLLQTSGSTSESKIVPIRMESLLSASLSMIKTLKLKQGERCLNFLPMNFIHGFVTSGFVPLLSGGCIIFPGQFKKSKFTNWLKTYTPNWFSASPTTYSDILKIDNQNDLKTPTLRFLRVGSAPISSTLIREVENAFQVPLIEAYGMTETLVISCNTVEGRKIGSVGQIINSKIKLINERGNKCKTDETGTIFVKGKSVTMGYLNSKESNTFSKKWFNTEDLGFIDSEGYLFITGREKEMINKGGIKISPSEIELHLKNHQQIEDACVFPIPHLSLGEDIGACIQTKNNIHLPSNQIKEYLLTLIQGNKIPSSFLHVTSFQKTENGKIIRKKAANFFLKNQIKIEKSTFTASEKWIKTIFERILKIEINNKEEDFFSLGGTSLDAVDFIDQVNNELKIEVQGIDFITNSTISSFSQLLSKKHYNSLNHSFQTNESTKSIVTEKEVEEMLSSQKKLLKSWSGIRKSNTNLLVGKNTNGHLPPIFWCFHNYNGLHQLSEYLGKDQPIYGLRSGHLVFKPKERALIKELAGVYALEIQDIIKNKPFFIGGSCQGARVAWDTAQKLKKLNYHPKKLFIMELNMQEPYDGPIELIYGAESPDFNPFVIEENPEKAWKELYPDYKYHIIDGAHGAFFNPNTIQYIGSVIKKSVQD